MSVKWMLSVRQHQLQTLHDELVFFGRFHRNPINKALHVVGVAPPPPPPPPLHTHTHTQAMCACRLARRQMDTA